MAFEAMTSAIPVRRLYQLSCEASLDAGQERVTRDNQGCSLPSHLPLRKFVRVIQRNGIQSVN